MPAELRRSRRDHVRSDTGLLRAELLVVRRSDSFLLLLSHGRPAADLSSGTLSIAPGMRQSERDPVQDAKRLSCGVLRVPRPTNVHELPRAQRSGCLSGLRVPGCRAVRHLHRPTFVRRADGLPLGVFQSNWMRLHWCRMLRRILTVRRRRKGGVQGRTNLPSSGAVLRSAGLRRLVHGRLLRGLRAADRVRVLVTDRRRRRPRSRSPPRHPARHVPSRHRRLGARGEHGRGAPRTRRDGPRQPLRTRPWDATRRRSRQRQRRPRERKSSRGSRAQILVGTRESKRSCHIQERRGSWRKPAWRGEPRE